MAQVWHDTQALVQSRCKVLVASGEFLAAHFAAQEKVRGIPENGYFHRPLIGLRLELPSGEVLTCRPGWRRSYGEKAGQLLLDRVDLELLGPSKLLSLCIHENGVKLRGNVFKDMSKNEAHFRLVYKTLYDMLADPMKTFAQQQDHCCCCGKSLTDIISRLRGIGPECIRYFGSVQSTAATVRLKHQYHSLDAEWKVAFINEEKQ